MEDTTRRGRIGRGGESINQCDFLVIFPSPLFFPFHYFYFHVRELEERWATGPGGGGFDSGGCEAGNRILLIITFSPPPCFPLSLHLATLTRPPPPHTPLRYFLAIEEYERGTREDGRRNWGGVEKGGVDTVFLGPTHPHQKTSN